MADEQPEPTDSDQATGPMPDETAESTSVADGQADDHLDYDESELVPDDEVLDYPVHSTEADEDPAPEEVLGSATDSADELAPGSKFARRYLIEEKLGEGASGAVFRATHELMRKTVAIKLLHADLVGDEERVERFRREAQATAAIDHPNVCGATDIDRLDDGRLYMVMEYLEGQTLSARLDEAGSLGFGEAIEIVDQVANALERAHELAIVHRDLKPDNIYLVDEPGGRIHVKILDFGLARVSFPEDVNTLTLPGVVAGTPKYFSPEQCNGETVDGRSDLYTLGLVFYQLVTGSPPFTSSDVRTVMNQHINERPPPPSTVAERLIPFAVERLIERLLEKDPEQRIQSAAELRRELAEIDLADSPTLSGAPSPAAPPRAHSESKKYIVGGIAALVLVAIMVVAITVSTSESEQSPGDADEATGTYSQDELVEIGRQYAESGSQKDRAVLVDHMSPRLGAAIADVVIDAPTDQYAEQRVLVRALLDETGVLGELEPWQQLGVRLRAEDAADCAARKPIVREIHKLADPRLLPTLQKLADSDLDNACMERTLPRAIGVLQTAAAEDGSEP